MAGQKSSLEWTKAEVVKRLREEAEVGQPVSAQVFLQDDVDEEGIPGVVQGIVRKVEKICKQTNVPLKVGKVRPLAKSFSVTADAEAVAAIADLPTVKAILPAEIGDIYPKPTKNKPG